ncbi:putative Cyclic AMP-responsive element-binding protein 3-like protein 2 [Hypsibius exemplaris]|uniref:Cyclic AMP-responsive element-binding protein 3-like protein 2 n=1 Tax=Hypsibius exemplaris TaxID=2072580 RepID=A0A9X6NFV9_HYPEX|nr:putative Cyclic AMP-responsive element-binding protein 3-like protein 2 [Hypsibius exemplaris]
MDTDEGIITDCGLWDRTFSQMDVDLLDSDIYRTDAIDYFNGQDFFVGSDPLLPDLLNSLVDSAAGGGRLHDDDPGHFIFSSGRRGDGSSANCHKHSDLDLGSSSSLCLPNASSSTEARIKEVAASFPLGEIIIKTEPCESRGSWLNPNGFDSDTSSMGSGGSRSPSQSHGKDSGFALTPTPPCSSDGESRASPLSAALRVANSSLNLATAISNSLSTGDDGSLLLTDEEKRTLTAEGYPIPSRLPLTKAEERSLKRIRRKIKNKISAQESRRKKKEYIESLEKKLKILNDDNSDLRRKLDTSENTNRSLADQLCKLNQTLLKAKVQITPVRRVIATQSAASAEKNS